MPDTAVIAAERTLPHNLEAERSVLGAILVHNDAYNLAVQVVDSREHSNALRYLMSMRRFATASPAAFGTRTVSTPFSNFASPVSIKTMLRELV